MQKFYIKNELYVSFNLVTFMVSIFTSGFGTFACITQPQHGPKTAERDFYWLSLLWSPNHIERSVQGSPWQRTAATADANYSGLGMGLKPELFKLELDSSLQRGS